MEDFLSLESSTWKLPVVFPVHLSYLLKFSFVSSYMIKFIFKFTSCDSIVLILIILGSEILVVGNTADTGLKIHVLLWLEAFWSTLFPTSEVVLFPSSPSGLSSFYFHFHSSDSDPYYACPWQHFPENHHDSSLMLCVWTSEAWRFLW